MSGRSTTNEFVAAVEYRRLDAGCQGRSLGHPQSGLPTETRLGPKTGLERCLAWRMQFPIRPTAETRS